MFLFAFFMLVKFLDYRHVNEGQGGLAGTTLIAESEEELKNLLMKVKKES